MYRPPWHGARIAVALLVCVAGCDPGTAPPPLATVEIEPAELTLHLGFTQQFTTVQRAAAGDILPPQPVVWIGSDQSVLELGGEGFARAVGPGGATVSAYVAGTKATAEVTVPPLRFTEVAPGHGISCGVTYAQLAYCWGENDGGQLGDSSTVWHIVPGPVAGGLQFRWISAATDHACAVSLDGAAYCWGWNVDGWLGDGVGEQEHRLVPTLVVGGLTFAGLYAAGVTCGLTAGGEAYCWGDNIWGSVGDGTTTDRYAPVPVAGNYVFVELSAGGPNVCGLIPDGNGYCWGKNIGGSLGDGTVTNRSVPTPVTGGLAFQSISAGGAHTCGVTTSGAGYCWGWNTDGQLGDGTMNGSLSPVAVVGGLTFKAIAAGGLFSCGLTTEGVAYCWGDNLTEQLGQPRAQQGDSSVPVAVNTILRFEWLQAGNGHTCGKAMDGILYCWGANVFGQLGIGTFSLSVDHPVPIFGQ